MERDGGCCVSGWEEKKQLQRSPGRYADIGNHALRIDSDARPCSTGHVHRHAVSMQSARGLYWTVQEVKNVQRVLVDLEFLAQQDHPNHIVGRPISGDVAWRCVCS